MQTFALFIKDYDDKVLSITKKLIASVNKNKYRILLTRSQAASLKMKRLAAKSASDFKEAAFVVSVGGDGTMLRCARTFSKLGLPIIGINLGRRGFLTEIQVQEFKKVLPKLFKNRFHIDSRMMLDIEVKRNGRSIAKTAALNDIVIGKNGIARIIRLDAFVSGKMMTSYAGDGLIISTPTGSTGHNLAANGPIIDPSIPVFVLTAICPLSISNRTIVVDGEEVLKITVQDTPRGIEAILTVDGQSTIPLIKDDEITVKKAPYNTEFIRIGRYNFFSVLKEKLGWGE
ncbi:MAG: NAD(+)/NADH kinase [Candidatus Margulisiibacteriota bacterium]